jgi:formate dehydrogenase subunit gamma
LNRDSIKQTVEETAANYAGRNGVLLAVLQEIQERLGYIPPEALPSVEKALGVPQGEAAAVVSFYSDLRTTPPARHHVRVCNGDSCAALGSRHLTRVLEEHTGTAHDDGHVHHDTVYCLGNCALSPSISVDGEVYGRVTPESLVRRLEGLDRD